MTTEYVSVFASWTVAQTLDHVRQVERSRETVYAIYVLDDDTHALLPCRDAAPSHHRPARCLRPDGRQKGAPVAAPALMKQEDVARLDSAATTCSRCRLSTKTASCSAS